MEKINFEEYRQAWETGPQWELKREFLERYQDVFPEERLLCLAQAYSNIELLHCSYPTEVMIQIHELSKSLNGCKRFRRNENSSQQDNDKSPQTKKEKRSLDDVQSPKKFKFIKFCSSDNTPKSTEYTSNVSPPIEIMNVDYSLITQSPDAKIIEKLASQVQKLLLIKKVKAMDAIQSAALLLRIKSLVDLKFTNQTTTNSDGVSVKCFCEFFVGTTRISIGDGNNKTSAQKKASEYALQTLMNFQSLPTKKLADIQKECEDVNLTKEKQSLESDLVNTKGKNIIEPCADNVSHNLNSNLPNTQSRSDIIFLQQFAKELTKSNKTNTAPLMAINETGRLLNNLELVVFSISEDINSPIHNRVFICNFSIKNIFISRGEATSKIKARLKAADCGVKCLLNLLEPNEKHVSNSENTPVTKDNLEERSTLDKLQSDASLNIGISNTILLEKTASDVEISKSTNSVKPTNFNKDSLTEKNICQNSSNNTCKVNNPNEDDELDKLSQVIRNSCEETAQAHCPTVNKTLLKNSFLKQLALFDISMINGPLHSTPGSILSYSAQQCRKNFSYNIEANSDGTVKVNALLDKKIVGTAVGLTKEATKKEAAKCAFESLRKEVITIKVKNEVEKGLIINRYQMLELAPNETHVLSEDNIGCKMLKMMGWSGGGIGKTEGIIEPVSVEAHSRGSGLGYQNCGKMNMNSFRQKVSLLLSDFSRSNSTEALIFSPEFEKSERKEIHKIAIKYNLSNNSYGKDEARQLCIKRKISVTELLNSILESGGQTDKYELVDIYACEK